MNTELRWQPIATAPKDGTQVLVFDEGAVFISQWLVNEEGDEGWFDHGFVEPPPTHWQPLPSPPQAALDAASSRAGKS